MEPFIQIIEFLLYLKKCILLANWYSPYSLYGAKWDKISENFEKKSEKPIFSKSARKIKAWNIFVASTHAYISPTQYLHS